MKLMDATYYSTGICFDENYLTSITYIYNITYIYDL
jgi:hypothetical protein